MVSISSENQKAASLAQCSPLTSFLLSIKPSFCNPSLNCSLYWTQTEYLGIIYLIQNKLSFHGGFYCLLALFFNFVLIYCIEYIYIFLASKLEATWGQRLGVSCLSSLLKPDNTLHVVNSQLVFPDFSLIFKILIRKGNNCLRQPLWQSPNQVIGLCPPHCQLSWWFKKTLRMNKT